MSSTTLLNDLVAQPNFFQLLEEAQTFAQKEKEARQQFLDLVHENMKAEFINGEVIMHSPVKMKHWEASMNLSSSMHRHVQDKQLGKVGVEKVMVHLTRNDYEPDICFFSWEKAARFHPDQMLFPAPDLIVEILSITTEKNDRNIKMQDYALHGVAEYWIIDPVQQSVEQYLLEEDAYKLQVKLVREGTIYAKAIEGYAVKLEEIF
jgi:Uma2 family endonuclease